MSKSILDIEPKSLWSNFLKISAVPRPSKKEKQITEFIKQFGENLHLETATDAAGNVIIRKPATQGCEKAKCVTLQGHLDMVPQKTPDSNHDFEKDAIKVLVDGAYVTADKTTLGADNGIGVAAMMSVLASTELKHGPIEALFTVDEETGMTGAFALTDKQLIGNYLLNLDGGDFGTLCIGCAGGVNTHATYTTNRDETPSDHIGIKINITGLKGGHSGAEIHLYRGNANKILIGILNESVAKLNIQLSEINGGNLSNVIPREASCVISIDKNQKELFLEHVRNSTIKIKNEFGTTDPGLEISITECDTPINVIEKKTSDLIIKSIHACPSGVVALFPNRISTVATSTNLSIIKTNETSLTAVTSQRSAFESARDQIASMVQNIFELGGASIDKNGEYPGWTPIENSEIIQFAQQTYSRLYGQEASTKIVHGGLECGLIKKKYPNMDMISIGPNISEAHSPNEKVLISSVASFWDYLIAILEDISKK